MREISRRRFIQSSTAAIATLGWAARLEALQQAVAIDPWLQADTIARRIRVPAFPARDFDITTFGATGDGQALCTEAIRKAIAACRAAGGGTVVVPDGRFLTGAVRLETGVNLHLSDKATLAFSQDPRHYLPVVFTRWEGVEVMNYAPFLYAYDAERIAITGRGTLDGQADDSHWWSWKGTSTSGAGTQRPARNRLIEMQAAGVPVADRVFGDGHCLRPNFIQPYKSRQVLIEGVTIVNSPMWEIHPVLCQEVTVRNVSINSHGPNNDGCDPESCRDVLIEGCTFDTGDDCIALKSGRNDDGRRIGVPIENVIVRNCTMKDGHGGVVIGSEISGGARNIFAERCAMDSPRLDRALRLKTNAMRGGVIEGVYMRDVTVGQVAEAVVTVDFYYEEGDSGGFTPIVRNIEVRNVTSKKSQYGLRLRGYSRSPVSDVRVVDCVFDGVEKGDVLENVRDLDLRNVRVNGKTINQKITR